jgi:nucleotide-binding universal stress UspA family protein
MTATFAPATKFAEILVATDFSDASDSALGYAKAMAKTFDSELLLVHVADPVDAARVKCELETTESAGATLRAEGFKVKELCEFGGVSSEIADAAQQEHADLVVTGTHCRKGLNRLPFGSEAENILKASRVPVLIVGPKATFCAKGKVCVSLHYLRSYLE